MTFQEIFAEKGLYRTEGFAQGYCFEVDAEGWLYALQYEHKDDILPTREPSVCISKRIFDKDFQKVFNRNQLFS